MPPVPQAAEEWNLRLEIDTGNFCANDPVNRWDYLGMADRVATDSSTAALLNFLLPFQYLRVGDAVVPIGQPAFGSLENDIQYSNRLAISMWNTEATALDYGLRFAGPALFYGSAAGRVAGGGLEIAAAIMYADSTGGIGGLLGGTILATNGYDNIRAGWATLATGTYQQSGLEGLMVSQYGEVYGGGGYILTQLAIGGIPTLSRKFGPMLPPKLNLANYHLALQPYMLTGGSMRIVYHLPGGPFVLFNKTHASSLPLPKGRGPWKGLLQSHHGLQQEWAIQNLEKYGYRPGLAPTVTLETGRGFPHSVISNLQTIRRNAREAAGLGKWGSTLDEELGYIVSDFRAAGFSDDLIKQVLEQQYGMFDKLQVPYTRVPGF